MIDQNQPFERLRASNPVPASRVPSSSSPAATALLSRILAGDPGPGAGPGPAGRPRRRLRVLVPAVLVASVAGVGAYAALTGDVTKPQSVACFQGADLQSRAQVVSVDGRGPVADCADLWSRGLFGDATVPDLAVCRLDSGAAGVFPTTTGAEVCSRLGLAEVTSSSPPPPAAPAAPASTAADENTRFLAFRDAVLPQFLDVSCVDPGVAQATVRRELDRAGLGDWTIRAGQGAGDGFSSDRPCATLSFRPAEHTVLLVPAPPRR